MSGNSTHTHNHTNTPNTNTQNTQTHTHIEVQQPFIRSLLLLLLPFKFPRNSPQLSCNQLRFGLSFINLFGLLLTFIPLRSKMDLSSSPHLTNCSPSSSIESFSCGVVGGPLTSWGGGGGAAEAFHWAELPWPQPSGGDFHPPSLQLPWPQTYGCVFQLFPCTQP